MLKGKHLDLRLVRATDLDDYIRWSQDIGMLGEYYPQIIHPESKIRRDFQEHGFWSDSFRLMLMVDPATDKMFGSIAAFKPSPYHDSVELGYIIYNPEYRGRGLTTEAVKLICGYLFRLLKVNRIQIQLEKENIASARTAEKAGFTFEGTLRQCLIGNGKLLDLEMYSLLRHEYQAEG